MANIMTKRGNLDNIVTYEHFCDTKADLANIPQNETTLGSTAIVLQDEGDSMGVYIANSNKEWIPFSSISGSSDSSSSESNLNILFIHTVEGEKDGATYQHLDKTWQEIYDADLVYHVYESDNEKIINLVDYIHIEDTDYIVEWNGNSPYVASSKNDYPNAVIG